MMQMEKWYNTPDTDLSALLSGRIRLARNLRKYHFGIKLEAEDAENMMSETEAALINDRNPLGSSFESIDLAKKSADEKLVMLERHNISMELMNKKKSPAKVLLKDDESISIMLNEEDHIRIQSILPGDNIDKAFDIADKIDDLLEETLDYAFHKDFGYLTACPTNVGTGLRASYMIHIPLLERTGQMKNILQIVSKFGMTLRGIYGEGSESMGGIYQISNQVTLGKSEQEIILTLKNVTTQIIDKETELREKFMYDADKALQDRIYRAYGTLATARRISKKEAMNCLSDIRLGLIAGLDMPKLTLPIYTVMIQIQPGNLQRNARSKMNETEMDIARADFLRGLFFIS